MKIIFGTLYITESEIIFGTLSITESELISNLEPGDNWLLLDGFPDPEQAGRAATKFILKKHLPNGAPVAVTGTRNAVGTQPVIVMTDINAADSLLQYVLAITKQGKAAGRRAKTIKRKSTPKKNKVAGKPSAKKVQPGGQK